MNDIFCEVENLKKLIIDSKEYQNYLKANENLDKNKDANKIINKIKDMQKKIVNKELKKEDIEEEEFILENLYNELNNIQDYNKYLEASVNLNNLITSIQKNFENYFNSLIS